MAAKGCGGQSEDLSTFLHGLVEDFSQTRVEVVIAAMKKDNVTLQDLGQMTRDDLYSYEVVGFKDARIILDRAKKLSSQSEPMPLGVTPPQGWCEMKLRDISPSVSDPSASQLPLPTAPRVDEVSSSPAQQLLWHPLSEASSMPPHPSSPSQQQIQQAPETVSDQESLCKYLKFMTLNCEQGIAITCQVFNAKTGFRIRGSTPPVTRDITTFPRVQEFSSDAIPLGFEIRLSITVDKSCFLYIINFGTSGATKLVFPNEYQSNNHLPAKQTFYLPGEDYGFKVEGKPGKERIQVLAFSRKAEQLEKYIGSAVESDSSRKHLLRDITVMKRSENTSLQWGSAQVEFTVQ